MIYEFKMERWSFIMIASKEVMKKFQGTKEEVFRNYVTPKSPSAVQ